MTEIVDFAVAPTAIEGLLVVTPKQVHDERGTVREVYRASALEAVGRLGLGPWAQINLTATTRGGLRGLHAEAMTKFVTVAAGEALGAYVDLRAGSITRGVVVTARLVPGIQVLVPRGVANGFQAVADGTTEYLYCFDEEWGPDMDGLSCNPLDPALAIEWPIPVDPHDRSQISARDAEAPLLADLDGADR